uniref:Uncharacterized protein n=1 Tax=Oryza meridionalis TaxID=40149 RepID=A0A0E0EAB9_9ORYZ
MVLELELMYKLNKKISCFIIDDGLIHKRFVRVNYEVQGNNAYSFSNRDTEEVTHKIRYRKKRREALGLDAGEGAERQEKKKSKRERGEEVTMELRMVGFGKEVVLKQRRRMRRRRRLGEEKAAILLMALSSCVIYA